MGKIKTVNILEEVKDIISSDINIDSNTIGLFYYLKLLKEKNIEYQNIISKFVSNIECVLEIDYGGNIKIETCKMDYNTKELILDIKIDVVVRRVYLFLNKNGQLTSIGDSVSLGYDILTMMNNNISKLYNIMLTYESFINGKCEGIKINNKNFYIDLYYDRVILYYGENKENSEIIIEIDSSLNYKYISDNIALINQFKELEDIFMKKLDVNVVSLPEWSHSDLLAVKNKQIITEMKRKREELRIQKRNDLLNKLTSIFKKR